MYGPTIKIVNPINKLKNNGTNIIVKELRFKALSNVSEFAIQKTT